MCHKRNICPHYLANTESGNFNACDNCEYVKQVKKMQNWCKLGLVCVIGAFITVTYILF